MLKAIIIDDEIRAGQSLHKMIQHVAGGRVEVLAVAQSAEQGLQLLKEQSPDLLFLDIQMPFMNGFELLEQLGKVDFAVIFTTAYDQFAIKAFRAAATDYLLKPIDMEELEAAIEKVGTQPKHHHLQMPQFEALFQAIQKPIPQRLALPTAEGLIFLPLANIIRLEADSNYTVFHTIKKERVIVSKTLKEFEGTLEQSHFFRIHNSHIINVLQIERYLRGDGGTVVMNDHTEIEVSRRRKEEFLKKIDETSLR